VKLDIGVCFMLMFCVRSE